MGEPINPDAWRWYHDVVGEGRCAVVDTWWQTETGGVAISPIAPATPTKPGSATLPLPGIVPSMRTPEGKVLEGPGEGLLCLDQEWPGQARTVWQDHERLGRPTSAGARVYSRATACAAMKRLLWIPDVSTT